MKISLTVIRDPKITLESDAVNTGGSGGTSDYNFLANRPQINGVTLQGNKTNEDININALTNREIDSIINSIQ